MRPKLGELLCSKGLINSKQLAEALEMQKDDPRKLGQILLDITGLNTRFLNEVLCEQAGIEKLELEGLTIPPDVLSLVPAEAASQYNVLPVGRENGRLILAMSDPFDHVALSNLRMITGLSIRRCYSRPSELEKVIQHYYGSNVARMVRNLSASEESEEQDSNGQLTASRLHELAREPSLVNLVNLILLEAIESRASDIHIEPFENQVKIKYRIDGMLIEKSTSPKRLQAAIISRIKIMAGMDIAERRRPQDGHFQIRHQGREIDLRVNTFPVVTRNAGIAEKVVMRIIDQQGSQLTLNQLGMLPEMLGRFDEALRKPDGIILVTGPTGSGKSTTLYAALQSMIVYSENKKNIVTMEDPVEYKLEGINQGQINVKAGYTFAEGMRAILRQDPDVIMVGEMRDKETCEMAIRAALTGHLVFSTLHTNDAAAAYTRLTDMGIEPFLISSTVIGILAQRLVRKICPRCKEAYTPEPELLDRLGLQSGVTLYRGAGCTVCNKTGYKGRLGIHEFLVPDREVQKLVLNRVASDEIKQYCLQRGNFDSMRRDGLRKAIQGLTSVEQVLGATQND